MALKDSKKSIPNWTQALISGLSELNLLDMNSYQLLCDWSDVFKTNNQIAGFLSNPSIATAQKFQILDALADKEQEPRNKVIINTIKLMVKKGKSELADKILSNTSLKLLDKLGVKKLKVYSKSDLTADFKKQIQEDMQIKFGKKVVADFETSSEILAGVRIVESDKILDLTVDNKIKKLFQKIMLETKLV